MKGKWILLGVLMLIPILVSKLLTNAGKQLTSEASLWMFLTIAGFFIVAIAVPKEAKKYAHWFVVIFMLLTLSSVCKKTPKTIHTPKPQGQTVQITLKAPVPQANPSQVIKTNWGYVIEFTGRESEGVRIFTAQEAKEVEVLVRWVPGGRIQNPEGISHTDPYGGQDYLANWNNKFRFSWCPGVKPHATLILIKKADETLDSVRQEDILFFKKPEQELRFRMNAGEELFLYYHDVNDPYYFQRNGSDGSYMRFEVEIL